MSAEKQTDRNDRDSLALIVGGLFIAALVFSAYNYFNKSSEQFDKSQEEDVFENVGGPTEEQELEGDINGEAAKDTKLAQAVESVNTVKGLTEQQVVVSTEWTANNYEQGDVRGASYTVKSGDTLWEIAEGAYGDGSQWTKILEANKNDVGFLANGKQALIVPGQVLVLP